MWLTVQWDVSAFRMATSTAAKTAPELLGLVDNVFPSGRKSRRYYSLLRGPAFAHDGNSAGSYDRWLELSDRFLISPCQLWKKSEDSITTDSFEDVLDVYIFGNCTIAEGRYTLSTWPNGGSIY